MTRDSGLLRPTLKPAATLPRNNGNFLRLALPICQATTLQDKSRRLTIGTPNFVRQSYIHSYSRHTSGTIQPGLENRPPRLLNMQREAPTTQLNRVGHERSVVAVAESGTTDLPSRHFRFSFFIHFTVYGIQQPLRLALSASPRTRHGAAQERPTQESPKEAELTSLYAIAQ